MGQKKNAATFCDQSTCIDKSNALCTEDPIASHREVSDCFYNSSDGFTRVFETARFNHSRTSP
jgi:hypothetical protein